MRTLLLAALALLSAGSCVLLPCAQCDTEANVLEINAVDAVSGGGLTTIQVSGVEKKSGQALVVTDCTRVDTGCRALNGPAGEIEVAVTAQGYQPAVFTVTVEEDNCGEPWSQHRRVAMVKQSAPAAQASVAEVGGFQGCHFR
jgi:hypothetical protein